MTSAEQLTTLLQTMPDIESFWILSLGDMRAKDPLEPRPILRGDYQHQIMEYLQTSAVKPYEHGGVVKCFMKGSALEWCPAPNDVHDHPVMVTSLKVHVAKTLIDVSSDWIKEQSTRRGFDESHINSFISSLTSQESGQSIVVHPTLYELCDLLLFVTVESIKSYIELCSVPHVSNLETYFLVDGIQVPKIQTHSQFEDERKKSCMELVSLLNNLNLHGDEDEPTHG